MKKVRFILIGLIVLMTCLANVALMAGENGKKPDLLIWSGEALYNVRQQVLAGKPGDFKAAIDDIKADADAALKQEPLSVVNKKSTPPSGDKHDYTSIGIYWWPNPNTPDGKPYIRKDGQVNPEVNNDTFDKNTLGKMSGAVQALSLGYYVTGNPIYAEHAAKLVKVWFLDPATRMNPNLNYGQFVPGVNDGRKEGIVETLTLVNMAEAVTLIVGTPAFSEADFTQLKDWYKAYLKWLLESKIGKAEAAATNNHGTWYDFQVAAYAVYTGQADLAKKLIQNTDLRLAAQLDAEGKMPQEMSRTRSVHYHLYNLRAFISLAILGDKVGVDIWSYKTADGRGIQKAIDFLAPFLEGKQTWPGEQINKAENESSSALYFRYAAVRYRNPRYAAIANILLGDEVKTSRINLFFPEPVIK